MIARLSHLRHHPSVFRSLTGVPVPLFDHLAAEVLQIRQQQFPTLKKLANATRDQDFVNKAFMFEHYSKELAELVEGLRLKRGRVEVDPPTGRTTNPKFFAGGDAVNGGSSAVQAVREAKLAARAIDEALR